MMAPCWVLLSTASCLEWEPQAVTQEQKAQIRKIEQERDQAQSEAKERGRSTLFRADNGHSCYDHPYHDCHVCSDWL